MVRRRFSAGLSHPASRLGVTLIEVLVVVSIVGLLAALLLPTIQQTRETARRIECESHLRQIATAVWNYEAAFGYLPPGATNAATWLVVILPQIEARLAIVPPPGGWNYSPEVPAIYHCPSDGRAGPGDASYAGNFGALIQRDGSNGMFRHGPSTSSWPLRMSGSLRARDVTDGLSQTAMVAEVRVIGDPNDVPLDRVEWHTPVRLSMAGEVEEFLELCLQMPVGNVGHHWMAGRSWADTGMFSTFYTHHLPPNSPRCTNGGDIQSGSYSPSSLHSGGANVVMGDGHVRLVASAIDRWVWQATGSRDGGEVAAPP